MARGKLGNRFTPCSTTVAPASVPSLSAEESWFRVNCVRGTRTQPLICDGCSVHYWVSRAINKGGFFEIAFVVVVDTHLPRFKALAYVLPHFDELNHGVIRAHSSVC